MWLKKGLIKEGRGRDLITKMNIEHRTSNSPEASKHLSAWRIEH